MGSCFGALFRVSTWGESHGPAVGAVIDGCPSRIPLTIDDIQGELDRRRPGQSAIATQRRETDRAEILSGVFAGETTGTAISILVRNEDQRSRDYDQMQQAYRPSHADFTYDAKYGVRDHRGGGRASARETIGRVAAGAVAKKVLDALFGVHILGYVTQVGDIIAAIDPASPPSLAEIEANPVRCPDATLAAAMESAIRKARKAGDSLGGIVTAVARNVPAGWGAPVFDKIDADLAKAMLSIPACKGFDIGSGFAGVSLHGSAHNDLFVPGTVSSPGDRRIRTRTNHSGGVQGGITNGEAIHLRAAFKPTATILAPQETVDAQGTPTTILGKGRHDPCVVPRAVPIVEAMMAIVLLDHALRQRGQNGSATPSAQKTP